MLPGSDGIELMESVPELSDETIARGLEAGAADYIVCVRDSGSESYSISATSQ